MANKPDLIESLESRVLRFIKEHNMIADQRCLLVAVSGGQDSVCLLDILEKLKAKLDVTLHVAHLNHQLRGADSDADEYYVKNLTSKMSITATIEKRDVKAYQARHRFSPEEAAREVRYTFLCEAARSLGTDRVAVAHTADDHIETILMHLIRGSGVSGLRGLRPVGTWRSGIQRLTIVRPLLEVSREETLAYCSSQGLMPRLDASNLSLSPFRNRIRLELLPLLKTYNSAISAALERTSDIAGEIIHYVDEECRRMWEKVVERQKGAVLLRKAEFQKLPPALQRHLLRLSIEDILPGLKDIESRHIEEIMAILEGPAGKMLNLPDGLVFAVDYDHYFLGQDPAVLCPFPPIEGEVALNVPGETRLPGWLVAATVLSRKQAEETGGRFTANFDLGKIGDKLLVRTRRTGDIFNPLGLGQPKKLGRFMIDARIPHWWRERVPVVASLQQPVWVVGWRIDDRVKISESTKQVLRLEFRRMNGEDKKRA